MSKPRHQDRTPGATRSSVARRAQPARQPSRRQPTSFWRGPWPIVLVLGAVVLLVIVWILISRTQSGSSASVNPTADPAVVTALANVSPSVTDAVGTGGATNPLTHISGSPLTGSGGKTEVLYVGTEWCPYCAAERWGTVVALSHFGTFSGLHVTTSSDAPGEVFPNTRTLSFAGSTFSSPYVAFVAAELEDRNHHPLQTMTSQEQQLAQAYDTNSGIPFLDLGNQYSMVGQGVAPDPLQNLSWQQIASALSNANSPVTKAIVGNANYLTAAICKLPGTSAATICSDPTIKQIEGQLPS